MSADSSNPEPLKVAAESTAEWMLMLASTLRYLAGSVEYTLTFGKRP